LACNSTVLLELGRLYEYTAVTSVLLGPRG
jgi:hypothetical protein